MVMALFPSSEDLLYQVQFYIQKNRLDLAKETQRKIPDLKTSRIARAAIKKMETVQFLSYNGNIERARELLNTIKNPIAATQAIKTIAWAKQGEELYERIEEEITQVQFDRALDLAWEIVPLTIRERAFKRIEEAKKEFYGEEYSTQRVKELLQCYEFEAAIQESSRIQDPIIKSLISDEIQRACYEHSRFSMEHWNQIHFISHWLSKGFFYSALSTVKDGARYFSQVKWIFKDLPQKNFDHANLLAHQIDDELLRNLCLGIISKSRSQG